LVRELNSSKENLDLANRLAGELKALGSILGILGENPFFFLQTSSNNGISAEEVEKLIAERIQAKTDKNYARADEIRKFLLSEKVVLEDSKTGGTQWRRE
jgi:cysteinyl-tRNA synthetase